MAELLEQRRGRERGGCARRVRRYAQRRLRHQPDAQSRRRRAGLLHERTQRRGRVVPGELVLVGDRVEHGGGVRDRPRDDPLDDRTQPALRQTRHAAATGLEADQPAIGGGNANRATAVVGVSDREHAGGDGRRGAAARASRRAARVPRVAAGAVAAVLGGRDHAELGGVGAPAQHEAGALERLDDQLALRARARGRAV